MAAGAAHELATTVIVAEDMVGTTGSPHNVAADAAACMATTDNIGSAAADAAHGLVATDNVSEVAAHGMNATDNASEVSDPKMALSTLGA